MGSPINAPSGEYNASRLEKNIFGPGKISALGPEMERRGLKRALVVTGKTLGASELLKKVTGALGEKCAGVFSRAQQHVPKNLTQVLSGEIKSAQADVIVSFGGGSPIDTVKVAIHALLGERIEPVHIAIPTTLSASEYTHFAGVTDESTLVKHGVSDPRVLPRTVINDPELTLATPPWLWATTGIRALDHAIESIYSVRHQPISDALAAKSIALLEAHLPGSLSAEGTEQLAHRGHCQMAAWFSIFGSMNTGFGLSHALGHQIGPRWGVPHGVTSCITLPHAMRFMAEVAPQRFGPIAEGYGIPFDASAPQTAALACAERTAEFIGRLDVPHRLRDAHVPKREVREIADTVQMETAQMKVVGRVVTREEILAILDAAY
jgi:alcohol dehydrogenase